MNILVVLSVVLSSQSFAAPARPTTYKPINAPTTPSNDYSPNNYSSPNYSSSSDYESEKQFYIFGGFDLGFSTYSTADPTSPGGVSRSGFHGGLRGLGSYYFKRWVIDGGLGFHLLSNSGTDPATGGKVSVTTRGTYLEISPRYFLNQHWQLGPVLDYWFTTDNGLNPNALSETPKNTSIWAGLQGVFEWPNEIAHDTKYRLGARWETGLNITARTVHSFQVFFQFGLSPFGTKSEEVPTRARSTEELNDADVNRAARMNESLPGPEPTPWAEEVKPEPIPESTPWPEVIAPVPAPEENTEALPARATPAKKWIASFDSNRLPFEANSTRLPRYHSTRVKNMGRFMGQNGNQWQSVTVSGYADKKGTPKQKENLSKARAQTVRRLLISGGAPGKKILIGKSKAAAVKRRVEFEFHGVKNTALMSKGVK